MNKRINKKTFKISNKNRRKIFFTILITILLVFIYTLPRTNTIYQNKGYYGFLAKRYNYWANYPTDQTTRPQTKGKDRKKLEDTDEYFIIHDSKEKNYKARFSSNVLEGYRKDDNFNAYVMLEGEE